MNQLTHHENVSDEKKDLRAERDTLLAERNRYREALQEIVDAKGLRASDMLLGSLELIGRLHNIAADALKEKQ